jgi:hypothetical protein
LCHAIKGSLSVAPEDWSFGDGKAQYHKAET